MTLINLKTTTNVKNIYLNRIFSIILVISEEYWHYTIVFNTAINNLTPTLLVVVVLVAHESHVNV